MTATAWGSVDRKQLLGRIFLLHLLNDTLKTPSDNSISEPTIQNATTSNRVLSLRRERELVETLAFLSATTDDPSKVVALCVEESQTGRAMTVRMAVNNGHLVKVQSSFERMARILERAATQDRIDCEQREATLLREIVMLNQNRILCRLRSKHATLRCNFKREKRLRTPIIPEIKAAIASVKIIRLTSIPVPILNDLKYNVDALQTLFARLEGMTKSKALSRVGLDLIIEITLRAQKIDHAGILEKVLTASRLCPYTVTTLTTTIRKLGRYIVAARFLIRAAGELPIFASIQISVIQLPPVNELLIAEPEKFVRAVLDGVFDASEIENFTAITNARLQRKYPRTSGTTSGATDILSTISSTRFVVHAEIQLLFHYELQPVIPAPRWICSSKKACFLCNLFVNIHGQFTIPRSHGRLYEKWTFPETIELLKGSRAKRVATVMDRFNDAVKEELRLELETTRRPLPCPVESNILISAVWSSPRGSHPTLQAAASESASTLKCASLPQDRHTADQDCPQNAQDAQVDANAPLELSSGDISEDLSEKSRTSTPEPSTPHTTSSPPTTLPSLSPTHPKPPQNPTANPTPKPTPSLNLNPKPPSAPSTYLPLTRGSTLTTALSPANATIKVSTPKIHLTLSLDQWSASTASLLPHPRAREPSAPRHYEMRLRWLGDGEGNEVGERGESGGCEQGCFVDVDALGAGEEIKFGEKGGRVRFCVARRGEVVVVECIGV